MIYQPRTDGWATQEIYSASRRMEGNTWRILAFRDLTHNKTVYVSQDKDGKSVGTYPLRS